MENDDNKNTRKRSRSKESCGSGTISKRKCTDSAERDSNTTSMETGVNDPVRVMCAHMFNMDEHRTLNSALSDEAVNAAAQLNTKISSLRNVSVQLSNKTTVRVKMCPDIRFEIVPNLCGSEDRIYVNEEYCAFVKTAPGKGVEFNFHSEKEVKLEDTKGSYIDLFFSRTFGKLRSSKTLSSEDFLRYVFNNEKKLGQQFIFCVTVPMSTNVRLVHNSLDNLYRTQLGMKLMSKGTFVYTHQDNRDPDSSSGTCTYAPKESWVRVLSEKKSYSTRLTGLLYNLHRPTAVGSGVCYMGLL